MNRRIINDPEVLSENYIPEKILNRENELSQISNSLGLVNSFVYGTSGSGKTLLVKKAIDNFNSSNKAKVIYIDCSLYQTTNAILHEILISLNSVVVSKSNYELTKRLQAKLKHVEERIIICSDHFEHLKASSVGVTGSNPGGRTTCLVLLNRFLFQRISFFDQY